MSETTQATTDTRGHASPDGARSSARPVILIVDDDADVVRAVARDLRTAFGEHYQIVRADSGAAALEAARTLKLQNRPVALFLADQRMPGMTGVEFLEQVLPIFPDAKRALLTAYADTDAAIRAINAVKLDYYLIKLKDLSGAKRLAALSASYSIRRIPAAASAPLIWQPLSA